MDEFEYIFIDKSGHCFDDFAAVEDDTDYHIHVANWFAANKKFSVGDMLCFRDELTEAGFKWGKDFYVKKQILKE